MTNSSEVHSKAKHNKTKQNATNAGFAFIMHVSCMKLGAANSLPSCLGFQRVCSGRAFFICDQWRVHLSFIQSHYWGWLLFVHAASLMQLQLAPKGSTFIIHCFVHYFLINIAVGAFISSCFFLHSILRTTGF